MAISRAERQRQPRSGHLLPPIHTVRLPPVFKGYEYDYSPASTMSPDTFYVAAQQNGGYTFGHRANTGSPVATTHRHGKFDQRVQQITTPIEDALVRVQIQCQQLQMQMADMQRFIASEATWSAMGKETYKEHAQTSIFKGQLATLNAGTCAYLWGLDPTRRTRLQACLGRTLRAGEDYYTLVKGRGAVQHSGSELDMALTAGESRFFQAFEAAKTALRQQGVNIFPAPLPSLVIRALVQGPISAFMSERNDHAHPLERNLPANVGNMLSDLQHKIESHDPFFTETPDMDHMTLVGVAMAKAVLAKSATLKSQDYLLLQ
eukprot:TRINITY_DN12922_c0_g1_i1.p1 TRINITY_DN12922_c0_g1~~TRINITY_DN12922_c0_g1_i1.p1  ORF type:complete len:319 (-),score=47.00 TRINITY_DN12922_c0_g1_i1:456-1412(-)